MNNFGLLPKLYYPKPALNASTLDEEYPEPEIRAVPAAKHRTLMFRLTCGAAMRGWKNPAASRKSKGDYNGMQALV